MVGVRGLEPLTPTASKSVRSAIKRHFGRLKMNEWRSGRCSSRKSGTISGTKAPSARP